MTVNDTSADRKPKGWPLFAIALLVVLLAGFLILRWRKKEEAPIVVKEPAPVTQPVPPTPVKAEPPVKPAPPAEGEFDRQVAEAKKSIEGKQWDAAAAAIDAARKLRPADAALPPLDASLAEGKKKDEAERAEAMAKAELKKQRERDWGVAREHAEKCRADSKWDEALKTIDDFLVKYPDAKDDSELRTSQRQISVLRDESDRIFKQNFADALKQFAEGRYGQAIASAESALAFYPERKAQVREFQDRAREIQMEKSMVRVSGTAWIGSEARDDEKPLRQVKLPPFLIDKYPVSNEDYFAFTAATGREAPPIWGGRKPPKTREKHPVTFITWDEAAAYAKWAGKRLPTAEEWEVAARGPDKREFPWDGPFQEKEDLFLANSLEYWQFHKNQPPGTTPVDHKEFDAGVSPFGAYGMVGNVWQWTATAAPVPADSTKPPAEFRVLKGGSFMTPQRALRCANLYAEDPRLPHPDVGFRCARDVK